MAQSSGVWAWSLAITACLTAYMQQTEEQYALPQRFWSRLPTHWSQAMLRGGVPAAFLARRLEGRSRWPP